MHIAITSIYLITYKPYHQYFASHIPLCDHMLQMSMQLPPAGESLLAQGISKLLCSHELSDMEFVIATPTSPVDTASQGNVVIPAHRVIVAARCEYFRMALQSGMKESIDR